MKLLRLGLTVLLLQPWLANSADLVPSVATSIESVRTGGYWETKQHRGRYRVVVAHQGFEHILSYTRVEWVRDPDRTGGAVIERFEVVHDSLLGSVDVESMQSDATGTVVVLAGLLHNGSRYRCQLTLTTDGSISKSSGC
jgi:hypothetical protein